MSRLQDVASWASRHRRLLVAAQLIVLAIFFLSLGWALRGTVHSAAHDLSNALEIIIQTSYLLSTTEMKEPASDWLRMLDDGVQKAMELNLALRTYIKEHTSN